MSDKFCRRVQRCKNTHWESAISGGVWCQRMRAGLDGFDGGFHKDPELR